MTLLASTVQLELYAEEGLTDAKATLLLEGASGLVRGYCGWRIDQATETLTADVTDPRFIALPTLHLTAVTAVRAGATALTTAEWSWLSNGLLLWPNSGLGQRLEADVTHGYPNVPPEVRVVVLAAALRAHLNPAAYASTGIGGLSLGAAEPGGLLTVERAALDPYRLPAQA